MTNLNKIWDCYLQNSCSLEEYIEEFLELYNKARLDNETLKQLFWSDDILGQFFSKFVEYALWVCRSSLTVGVMEDDAINSDSPELSTSLAAISLSAPDRAYHPSPECPGQQEKTSATDLIMTTEPAKEPEPEPAPATDHEHEPSPTMELETVKESQSQCQLPYPSLGRSISRGPPWKQCRSNSPPRGQMSITRSLILQQSQLPHFPHPQTLFTSG